MFISSISFFTQPIPSSALAILSPVKMRAKVSYFFNGSSSLLFFTASIFTSITAGKRVAQTAPWATGNIPPKGPAKPWTAPSFTFANAIPPSILANAIFSRACKSVPFLYALSSEIEIRSIPSLPNKPINGVVWFLTKNSSKCVNASPPVLAVSSGGIVCVNTGSINATSGYILLLRKLTFTLCSVDFMTEFLVTSAPVPEVVGTAILGSGSSLRIFPCPITSR